MKNRFFVFFQVFIFSVFFINLKLLAQSGPGQLSEQEFSGASAKSVFIENAGQIYDGKGNFRSDVDFMTSAGGTNIYFTDHGIVYHFFKVEPSKYDLIRSKKMENPYTPQEWEQINKDIADGKMDMDLVETRGKQYRIDIEFPGADLSHPAGEKSSGMKRNYFHPHYSDGIYGVSSFEQIRYSEVYPGIDLIFYFRGGQLKYDFELAAGADPDQIRILYKGHQNIKLDSAGNAIISILPGEITEQAPVAYQNGNLVSAAFKLSGDTLCFSAGDYDTDFPLTIDPALRWSTYFYDNSTSAAFTYARPQWDTNGNMFVLMDTYATSFPTVNPGGTAYYDFSAGDNGLQMVIMKFDPYRNLVWATYYCSSQSLSTNFCNQGLVIDQNNEIYCVGHMFFVYGTPAAAFPTLIPGGAYSETTPGNNRNCILKFANDGTRIWSTVFCTSGASSSGLDISGLAIDGSNRLVMVGDSYTPPSWTSMPVVNPGGSYYYNAAPAESATPTLHRFSTGLALQYSTYVSRGVASQYFNYGSCVAIDASNNIFMGNSGTGNITTANPGGAYIDGTGSSARKIILYKFLSSGALSWCTLYGGSTSANGIIWQDVRDVDIASNGDVIFVGRVNTTNFPTYNPGSGAFYKSTLSAGSTSVCDGVILKFSNVGVRLWATYIGGDGTSDGTDLLGMGIDENDNVYTSGICRSTSFPTQTLAGSYNQSTMTGSYAIILNMFNSSCVRQWGTYFGTGTWMSSGGFGVDNWVCDGVKLMQFGSSPSATPITTLDPGSGAYFHSTIEGATCDFFAEFFYGTETTADATISAVSPVCINSSAFNLSAATSGGTWSGTGITNSTNGTFNPATAGVGTHTITYTISGICGDTDTETITVNALPTVSASVTNANICQGESTTISASGGTTYSWSHSLGSNSSYSVSPSATTTYTVTGTSSGCTNTATITVNVTARPTVNASATVPTICNGASTTISATGATTYNWSNSLGTNSAYSVSPSSTTTYTVTGTASGCTNTASVTVTVNAIPSVSASATVSPICNGSSSTISASGATTYNWSNSLGTNSSYSVSPSSTTTYTVTGTSSGCTNTATVTVAVNAVPSVSASATVSPICNGSSSTISASGATTYNWSNSLGTNSSYSVSPSSTTTYTVTGTTSGCTNTATVTVTVNAIPSVSASATVSPICNGSSSTISASGASTYNWSNSLGTNSSYSVSPSSTTTYTVTGTTSGCTNTATVTVSVNAVPSVSASATVSPICNGSSSTISASGASTYNWSNSLGTNSSYSVSPSSTTTYTVTGTTSGCTNTATVTVSVNAVPSVSASATVSPICNGSSTTISATGATTYNWSNSLGTNSAYSVSPSSTTTYTVTGTSSGCTNTATVTVTVNAVPSVSASATVSPICNGSSTTISASGATTYNWSNSLGTNSSYSVSPSSTTTYTVTGTSSGCTNTATVTVAVNAVPSVSASATVSPICDGSSSTISASGATTYNWSNSLGTNSSYSVSPSTTTTYTVTGTSSGCTNTAAVTVAVNAVPSVSASATVSPICNGSSTTISASGATTYNWSNSLGTNSSYSVSPSSTTIYTVTGTASGCTNTATVSVTVNNLPAIAASATYPSLCIGESTDISATGGSIYAWDNSLGSGSTHNVTPLVTTTYNVTGTDGNGCSNTASVTVTITTAPAVTATAGTTSLCVGSSTTLNGGGAVNYSWDQGLGTGGSFIISPTTTTTYHVTGSSATGCSATAEVTVTVNPVPTDPTAAGTPSQICLGDSAVITASGSGSVDYEVYTAPTGGTYLGDASLTVYPTTTTVYYVQSVNSFGCANTGGRVPVTIIVNPLPVQPSVSASDTTICEGETVALLAGGSGSGVVYEVWTTMTGGTMLGYAPMMVSPSSTTSYYVQAVTAAGCTPPGGRVEFTFTVNPVTDAAMNPAGPFCISDATATLTAVNSGGTWSGTGVTNTSAGTFDPGTAGVGTHEITYTTTGVCPDTDTMNIVVTNLLDATITQAGPFCLSDAAVTLTAATPGGTWSGTGITNTTSGTFDPATAGIGTHEIVYTTTGSCGDTDTIQITVADQMDATITAAGPFCETETGLLLTAANAGGTWSGTGILNAASGLFDPATAGPGTHQIKYVIPGSCGDADSINIVVFDSPDFTYVATDESCTGAEDGSIALTVTGGMNPITYTWNTGASAATVNGIGEGNYLVTVTDANGCERSGAIALGDPAVACDDVNPHAIVPNAFSPNGDGENDVLYVRGEGVSQLSFIVYDRWGEKVFSTTSLDYGWDGTFRGKELDPAVFTYYLHAIFVDGSDKIEKGDITLTR